MGTLVYIYNINIYYIKSRSPQEAERRSYRYINIYTYKKTCSNRKTEQIYTRFFYKYINMRPLGDKSPVQIDMGEYNRNFLVDSIYIYTRALNKSGVKLLPLPMS